MGKKSRSAVTSSKRLPVAGISKLYFITKSTLICGSVIVATLGYALYHLFPIGAHRDWIYSLPTTIRVERYVMNDSISYQ